MSAVDNPAHIPPPPPPHTRLGSTGHSSGYRVGEATTPHAPGPNARAGWHTKHTNHHPHTTTTPHAPGLNGSSAEAEIGRIHHSTRAWAQQAEARLLIPVYPPLHTRLGSTPTCSRYQLSTVLQVVVWSKQGSRQKHGVVLSPRTRLLLPTPGKGIRYGCNLDQLFSFIQNAFSSQPAESVSPRNPRRHRASSTDRDHTTQARRHRRSTDPRTSRSPWP